MSFTDSTERHDLPQVTRREFLKTAALGAAALAVPVAAATAPEISAIEELRQVMHKIGRQRRVKRGILGTPTLEQTTTLLREQVEQDGRALRVQEVDVPDCLVTMGSRFVVVTLPPELSEATQNRQLAWAAGLLCMGPGPEIDPLVTAEVEARMRVRHLGAHAFAAGWLGRRLR